MRNLTRRDLLAATTGVAGFTFLPARVLGRGGALPPSEKLNVAGVGIGDRGSFTLREVANLGHNIVAVCDVDWRKIPEKPWYGAPIQYAWYWAGQFPKARKYEDYRIMLEKEARNIDAVFVATTDHTHAVISLAAMKMGKHAYAEKPMAHSVEECRAMAASAKKHKVTTQAGFQGHASEACIGMVEAIKAGAIGDVREVQIFGRDTGGTPYADLQVKLGKVRRPIVPYADLAKVVAEDHPVPEGLNWDLWLGPRPFRGYNPVYVPGQWRSWWDFGDGQIGDMGCHFFDPAVWALDLGLPDKVEARTDAGYHWPDTRQAFPRSAEVRWQFPARGRKPPVTVTYRYGVEGGQIPLPQYWKDDYWPRFVDTHELSDNGGVIIIGSKGAYVYGAISVSQPESAATGQYKPVVWTAPETCRLIPDELDKSYQRPPRTIPRVYSHWADWLESAKAGKPAGANFSVGSQITEILMIGNIACTQKGKTLEYDARAGRFKNSEEANRLLKLSYRPGFEMQT